MFTQKQTTLTGKIASGTSTMTVQTKNPFVRQGIQKSLETRSGNGSQKMLSSGSDFVDQFNTVSQYKSPRSYADVSKDMQKLWNQNKVFALAFVFYLRMITRIVSFFDGTKTTTTQRGQGLKHESIFRMIWLHVNAPDTFWKNIVLFISVGSWKDIITMLSYDLQWHGWKDRVLDWNKFGTLILAGLENPNQSNLLKKYLPQIKANNSCKTIEAQADNAIAKWICSLIYGGKTQVDNYQNYRSYRKLKTSGTAHEWQKLISQHQMLKINFDTIHGRALAQLVSGKFLANQGLEKRYEAWISQKPVAKFTGYVYELTKNLTYSMKTYQIKTIDAQFNNLVETARKSLSDQGLRPISVLDCSRSMNSPMYLGNGEVGKLKSIEVAMSSAIFFNEMLSPSSPFYNTYLSFNGDTQMYQFKGKGFVNKYLNSSRNGWGGTNFESVFTFFAKFKRSNPGVDESLIPNFIVCFSDGEFNAASSKRSLVAQGRIILRQAGYSQKYCDDFGMCFVDLPNTFYSNHRKPKFETFADTPNVYYFSGYDLSPLAFLFGVVDETGKVKAIPRTADELFQAAMDQEVLRLLEV